MNRLIQLITGLTLYLLLQACLSLPVKEAIPSWQIQGALAGFEDAIPKVKAKALEKLKEFGALNKVPSSQIGKLSQHSDFEVRFSATQALHEKGTTEVIPYLIDRLKDEKSKIRCSATYALGELGAKAAIPHLMEQLKSGNQLILEMLESGNQFIPCNRAIAEALGKLGGKETASQLLELLQSDEPLGLLNDTQMKSIIVSNLIKIMLDDRSGENKGIAAFSLARLSNDTEIKSIVMSHLEKIISDHRDSKITQMAMGLWERILSAKLDEKEVASELLTKWSQDVKLSVRIMAAIALGKMATPSLVSQLLTLLKSEDAQVRELTLEAFRNIETKAVAPQIMTLLKDERHSVRDVANYVLVKIGAKEAPAVKVDVQKLVESLKNPQPTIQYQAILNLENLGEKKVIPQLLELLNYPDRLVRIAAIKILGKSGEPSIAPQLLTFLTEKDLSIRSHAVEALSQLKEANIAPQLIELLSEQDSNLRWAAAEVLSHLPEKKLLPQWIKQLKDKETPIREIAIEALGNLGEKAAILPLVEELNAPGPYPYTIRQKTVKALGKLNATEAIPQLITLLTDPSDEVRSTTINVLGRLNKVELKHFLLVVDAISYASSEENIVNLRFLAHLVGGGDPKAEILLKWLGYPQANYPTTLTHDQAVQILPVFKEALELTPPNLLIRNHLEKQMKIIMNEIS
jgi:HEAT repeat protein